MKLERELDLLRLLFANLGRNACQYNEREPIRITIRRERSGSALWLHFSDNGVGIPPGEVNRVFGEFHRAPRPEGAGVRGSGLGLALCRRIVRLHRGRIRILKTGPEGTTFEIVFPRGATCVAPAK